MKKKMLATTLLTGLLAACSGNSASVTGVWIEPIPGMEDQVQGIKLEEGGIASSVNMATLVYKNWKQEGDQLILAGNSIGNGQTIEFIDTMKIKNYAILLSFLFCNLICEHTFHPINKKSYFPFYGIRKVAFLYDSNTDYKISKALNAFTNFSTARSICSFV